MLLPYHRHHAKSSPASSLLSSELLQHHLLHVSSLLASQKQATVELGGQQKHRAEGKSCKLENSFSPYEQKSGALHSSLASRSSSGLAVPALLRTQILL